MVSPKGQKPFDIAPAARRTDRADPTEDRPNDVSPPTERVNFALVVSEDEETVPDEPIPAGWSTIIDGTTDTPSAQPSQNLRWPDRLASDGRDNCLEDSLSTKRETRSLEEVVDAQDGSWTG